MKAVAKRLGARLGGLMPGAIHSLLARLLRPLAAPPFLGGTTGRRSARPPVQAPVDLVRQAAWAVAYVIQLRAPVVVPWHEGLSLRLFLSRDSSRSIFTAGRYEPNEMHFFRRYLEAGMVVIDVGANEGVYTLVAARAVGAAGRVVAVEPSHRELERLQANLRLNRLDGVHVLPMALLDQPGSGVLHTAPASRAGHNTFGGFASPGVAIAADEVVEVTTLDDLVEHLGWSASIWSRLTWRGPSQSSSRARPACWPSSVR